VEFVLYKKTSCDLSSGYRECLAECKIPPGFSKMGSSSPISSPFWKKPNVILYLVGITEIYKKKKTKNKMQVSIVGSTSHG
jgi:hypothetical protein